MSFITVVCVIHDIWDAFENDFGSVEKCFPGLFSFLLLFFLTKKLERNMNSMIYIAGDSKFKSRSFILTIVLCFRILFFDLVFTQSLISTEAV